MTTHSGIALKFRYIRYIVVPTNRIIVTSGIMLQFFDNGEKLPMATYQKQSYACDNMSQTKPIIKFA